MKTSLVEKFRNELVSEAASATEIKRAEVLHVIRSIVQAYGFSYPELGIDPCARRLPVVISDALQEAEELAKQDAEIVRKPLQRTA